MHDHAQCLAGQAGLPPEEVEHAYLLVQVQVVGRFIEQQQLWILGKQHGYTEASSLATGQGLDTARLHVIQFDCRERGARDAVVVLTFPLQRAQPGMASGQHRFHHAGGEGIGVILRQQPDLPGTGPVRHAGQRAASKRQPALVRPVLARQRAQQRGLAGAVASQYAPALTRRDAQVEIMADRLAGDRYCELFRSQQHLSAAPLPC